MFVRKWATKAWEAISHTDTAISALSLFPWKSGLAIMAGLTPAALSIGSVPAWAIALVVLIGLCVAAAFLSLLLYIREKILGTGIPVPRGKKQKRTDDSEIQQLHRKLSECKKDHAKAALQWFAARVEMNTGRMRDKGEAVKDIRVTVRFAEYKDLDLAKEIEVIIKECTQWPIEVDGSNKPTIMPDGKFKVVF